jgi:hypothetical protein
MKEGSVVKAQRLDVIVCLTLWRRNFLLNFSTPCIQNVNNKEKKKGSIKK